MEKILKEILRIILQFGPFLIAVSVHEAAHGWMAEKFGDPTARRMGRITLNPIRHVDLIGSIIFPFMMFLMGGPVFGWAKPVPVNHYNLRNPRKDNIFISAAGPMSNLIMAFLGGVIFLILNSVVSDVKFISLMNVAYSSGIFPAIMAHLMWVIAFFVLINVVLAVFNLIPIPPLDGSWILEGVLSGDALYYYRKIKPYGFIILLGIIFFGNLGTIFDPIIKLIEKLLI